MDASKILNDSMMMAELEVLKIQDVQSLIKHLSKQELLEEIQEQAGVIQDAQLFITAAVQLLFERA